MKDYEIHACSMDIYAANRIAAKQARVDQMPITADRHDALAVHMQNAQNWAAANCPPGYTVDFKLVFTFTPDVHPTYVGPRDIYTHEED